MDDPKWLRLVTVGLVLAALAVGYFLLTGRLASNSATKTVTQVSNVSPAPSASSSASPAVLGQNTQGRTSVKPTPTATPVSAYNRITNRTQGQNQTQTTQATQTLPNTGFPMGLAAIFSISAVISGWGLRKFPH